MVIFKGPEKISLESFDDIEPLNENSGEFPRVPFVFQTGWESKESAASNCPSVDETINLSRTAPKPNDIKPDKIKIVMIILFIKSSP